MWDLYGIFLPFMKIVSLSFFLSICFFPFLFFILLTFLSFLSVGWAGTRLVDFCVLLLWGLGGLGLGFC